MKRLSIISLFVLCVLTACVPTDPLLTNAADRFVNQTVGPEYEKYVDADATLDDFQKRIRHDNVQAFRDAVAAVKGINQ